MFERELVVIGVHAGKYPPERSTARIRSACARLGVSHPVVNDRQFRVWRSYAVDAWPTVVLVGADGRVVGQHAGEFEVADMAGAIRGLIEAGGAEIDLAPRSFGADPAALAEPGGPLRFPGKLLLDGETLFVSDTGHHRVLELRLSGTGPEAPRAEIVRVVGSGHSGFDDGEPADASFHSPQGLARLRADLYVADRANHALRAIDVASGHVRTVAGTGDLASGRMTGGPASRTALRSPWDIAPWGGAIAVAMAGAHQLWRYDPESVAIAPLAGTGGEDIADGPAETALLAQPMGVAAAGGAAAFCDAESSSVRMLEGSGAPAVRTVVGTGLFDFGDRDGTGDAALLQHAESVAWDGQTLVVADTYNDKLRRIDPTTRACASMPGDAGSGTAFEHPAGVAVASGVIFVADTDSHRIATVDPGTGEVRTLEIV